MTHEKQQREKRKNEKSTNSNIQWKEKQKAIFLISYMKIQRETCKQPTNTKEKWESKKKLNKQIIYAYKIKWIVKYKQIYRQDGPGDTVLKQSV